MGSTADKITLYTNHRCPWAHRAHIVVKELGLKYEEVIIDLDRPREPWYLEVNPRGLVPAIKFNDQIVTESGVVARFLADAYPSHLIPATGTVDAALTRARINFFVDTWFDKVGSYWFQILRAEDAKKEELVKEFVEKIEKEIEPLLKDASPFFGGSKKVTLAEALTAPFILRVYSFSKNGLLPRSVLEGLEKLPNFSKWAQAVNEEESVTYIWNADEVISATKKKIESLKAAAK
ncbi:thioredoxin-like protein [Didymella exigua CBS 183.55]|uniref:Thioredoxin-like protein n=1 Tax=Didymella exigua CBS 183.55 TaxID=1150837 RepID=A0A6A5RRL1_9PLEO|nr:thioredoxin-like protein [Didymella exigua CBS 183.55]KAF1929980.1 thioredoxin-like protein [Didymella exigua CBS 183.55]